MTIKTITDEALCGAVRHLSDAQAFLIAAMNNYREYEDNYFRAGIISAFERSIREIRDELHEMRSE